jgi:dipeptidase D
MVDFEKRKAEILSELAISDPNTLITIETVDLPEKAMSVDDTINVTNTIQAMHNGVFKMSLAIPGLVETSSSLARVIVKNGEFKTQSLQRSSLESGKMEVAYTIGSAFKLMGCDVEHAGSYPGWNPNPKSEILDLMKDMYEAKFKESPRVQACHAGLECGILGLNYPGLDMISFGPTIRNPHSPDEKVNIKTVEKFWYFLVDILAATPTKN